MEYLKIIIIAIIAVALAKFILNLSIKKVVTLILNAVVGMVVIWLINLTGLITIPLNIVTSLVVGILGLPGVVLLVLLIYFGII